MPDLSAERILDCDALADQSVRSLPLMPLSQPHSVDCGWTGYLAEQTSYTGADAVRNAHSRAEWSFSSSIHRTTYDLTYAASIS